MRNVQKNLDSQTRKKWIDLKEICRLQIIPLKRHHNNTYRTSKLSTIWWRCYSWRAHGEWIDSTQNLYSTENFLLLSFRGCVKIFSHKLFTNSTHNLISPHTHEKLFFLLQWFSIFPLIFLFKLIFFSMKLFFYFLNWFETSNSQFTRTHDAIESVELLFSCSRKSNS